MDVQERTHFNGKFITMNIGPFFSDKLLIELLQILHTVKECLVLPFLAHCVILPVF